MFIILALLALAGGAFSYYFLRVYRGSISPDVWWVPPVCRVERTACRTIVDTPFGTTFGKPNAFWGSLAYPVLFGLSVVSFLTEAAHAFLLPFSLAMVTVSLYLVWGLIKLRTACRVCIAVHTINFLFFLLIILDLYG
ncbi:MAG: vitamin K epoxide reductase family protein [Fidelibacterota bacterium]